MAHDDSTRCLRCRSPKSDIVDDGSNPPFRLCSYCQRALIGAVTIIDTPVKPKEPTIKRRGNPKSVRIFWRKRKEAIGR